MATRSNRVRRVMVNLSEEDFQRLEDELQHRRGRNSYSTIVRDALVFFFAYRDSQIAQRETSRSHTEQNAADTPVTPQDGPRSRPDLREV